MRNLNINQNGRNNPNPQPGLAPINPNQNPGQPQPPVPGQPAPTGMTPEDWKRLIKSILVSALVFWASFLLLRALAPGWYFWIVVLISFIVSMLVLAAVDAAVIYKSGLGVAVTLFIVIQAIILLVGHYGHHDANAQNDREKDPPAAIAPVPRVVDQMNSSGFLILLNTSHVFQLKDGEESPWFGAPENTLTEYTISSPTYNYRVYVSDGTDYPGGVQIPKKGHVYYKVKANGPEFVTVTFNE